MCLEPSREQFNHVYISLILKSICGFTAKCTMARFPVTEDIFIYINNLLVVKASSCKPESARKPT